MKTVQEMKKSEFYDVPVKPTGNKDLEFHSLVIVPQREFHNSGYRIMGFVAVDRDCHPICWLSKDAADILYIDGIGGYGDWNERKSSPTSRPIIGWKIDCLPCGYLRLFCNGVLKTEDNSGWTSSFEMYYKGREDKDGN